MQPPADYFSLFGLSTTFEVDKRQLDSAYRQAQSQVHPDRFATASAAEQRQALQWATWVNEAYQTLKSPLERARYLLSLHGVSVDEHTHTAMSSAFLMQQMTWRESLAEAKITRQSQVLDALAQEVQAVYEQGLQQLAQAFATQQWDAAADQWRQLRFLNKLDHEITDALVDVLA